MQTSNKVGISRVVVGRLGRPHGIRGEVTVEIRTDEPELRFAPGSSVFLSNGKTIKIESIRWHQTVLLVKFEGITDRNDSETLRDNLVEVDVDDLDLPEDEDEYYDRQLLGLKVIANGEQIGILEDVLHLPGHDLLSIKLNDGKEMLLPFVEKFVPEINLENGTVTVEPPQGLMEEETNED
jgi:16S rRNA processing protein RimM